MNTMKDKETVAAKLRNALSPHYGLPSAIGKLREHPNILSVVEGQAMQALRNNKLIDDLLKQIDILCEPGQPGVDVNALAEQYIRGDKDFNAEGFSEYQNGKMNGFIDGYNQAFATQSMPIKEIEDRIASLEAENELTLKEYSNCSEDLQDTLAERNMRIGIELRFLKRLYKPTSKPSDDIDNRKEDLSSLKSTLARAYLIIDRKVTDNMGIRVDIGTVFNKDQVLREIEHELKKIGALSDKK